MQLKHSHESEKGHVATYGTEAGKVHVHLTPVTAAEDAQHHQHHGVT